MDERTAKHLTQLRHLAEPITAAEAPEWFHPWLGWEYIKNLLLPIEQRHAAAAQAEEIRAAARERRDANSYYCGIGRKSSNTASWHGGGYGMILLAICRGEIDAAIAADDARRAREYEAYRMACEQGVALPPS